MKAKKICVVTGSRSEYGILFTLLKMLKTDKNFELELIVTGTHLSDKFGKTINAIINDGFKISAKVEMNLDSASNESIGYAIGLGTINFTSVLTQLTPDLLILQGDRFEMLAAANAAVALNIPIAHIHGGESTEGVIDEQIRHSITKMSHLHFCATEFYKRRIIQMGENPKYVFNVGAPALDLIKFVKYLPKQELEKKLKIPLNKNTALLTYHPVTLSKEITIKEINNLIRFMHQIDLNWLITYPNADNYNDIIIDKINEFSKTYKKGTVKIYKSLGNQMYFNVLKHIGFVIGNSSSGIIEVAMFKKPVINIGIRQKGRIVPENVITVENVNVPDLFNAYKFIHSDSFIKKLKNLKNLYGNGNATKKIINILHKISDFKKLLNKKFIDIQQWKQN